MQSRNINNESIQHICGLQVPFAQHVAAAPHQPEWRLHMWAASSGLYFLGSFCSVADELDQRGTLFGEGN